MLAGTIDTVERFLVQQHPETMLAGYALHDGHQQHVVVYGQIGLLKDGSQLKLVGSHLVVTGLAGNTQFESLYLQFTHEGSHALGNGSEVVVVHLLVLG